MLLSNCNWGNQAQSKQPCSLYSGTHVNIGVRGINLACLATCNEEAHGVCISWIHPRSCDVMHSIFWPNYQTKVNFENHYRLWDEFWISEFFCEHISQGTCMHFLWMTRQTQELSSTSSPPSLLIRAHHTRKWYCWSILLLMVLVPIVESSTASICYLSDSERRK